LIHVRRADWAPVVVEEALRTIFWFHPLVHWAVAEIRLAREELVDRDVVARTGARRAYLELLLSFGAAPAAASGPVSFFVRRQLERRIRGLTQEVTMTRARLTLTALMALTMTGAANGAARYAFPLVEARSAETATAEKTLPKVVHEVAAVYPEDAKQAHVEGVVEVAVTVDTDGAVAATRVVKSVAMLDDAAEAALKQWRFEPGREDGKPVRVEVNISVRFSLK
jgi:TonB family protein